MLLCEAPLYAFVQYLYEPTPGIEDLVLHAGGKQLAQVVGGYGILEMRVPQLAQHLVLCRCPLQADGHLLMDALKLRDVLEESVLFSIRQLASGHARRLALVGCE